MKVQFGLIKKRIKLAHGAFLHALTSSEAVRNTFIELANGVVREYYEKAQEKLKSGDVEGAYKMLGIALHPLQDATSPAHGGFQVWNGHEGFSMIVAHVSPETAYPGVYSNPRDVTNNS